MGRDRANLRRLMMAYGFGDMADVILSHARPSIRVLSAPTNDPDLPLGTSKIGGWPDLPYSAGWPNVLRGGRRVTMPFIAQLNLADVAGFEAAEPLPPRGVLYFFAETGLFPHYGKQGRVLYFRGDATDLVRRQPPRGVRVYRPCVLDFIPEVNVRYTGAARLPLPADKTLIDFYDFQRATHHPPENGAGRGVHRLMGVPYGLPSEIGTFCHLLRRYDNPYLAPSRDWQAARDHEDDWRLLLEIGEDAAAGLDWMNGAIGFAIRHADIAAHNFQHVCFQHKMPDFGH